MRTEPVRLAVFLSGSGSNFQAILHAIEEKKLNASITMVVSNKSDAYGLTRAMHAHIPTMIISYPLSESAIHQLLSALSAAQVECVLLAGFLRKIPNQVLAKYPNRVLNIHPALLPKFGGKGMYGHHVHEAVLASGDTLSGATVHLVSEQYDTGDILAQQTVPVLIDDTPETLAQRVLKVEHELYPRTAQQFLEREFDIAPITSTHH